MGALKEVALWVFGLLASGIFGGMIGSRLADPGDASTWGTFGFLGGMFAFACARLWLGGRT